MRHFSICLLISVNKLVTHLTLKQVLNDSSLFFFNSLIHLTLHSAFIYHVQQKFIMTLMLMSWLIRTADRVRLQQWREAVFKLKHRLNRDRMFNWRKKHKLSRFLKGWYKDRRDTEQKRFIISILTLSQKELKDFLICQS